MDKRLTNYIHSLERKNGTNLYAESLTTYRNEPCLNTYALRYNTKDKKPLCKLVYRETLSGKKWFNTDLYYGKMCGWRTLWNKKWSFYYYNYVEPMNKLRRCDKESTPHMNSHLLWDKSDAEKLFPILKYFKNIPIWELFDFIRKLQKYPMLELVYKNPQLHHLWRNTNLYKMSGNKRAIFMAWVKEHEKEIIGMSYNEIMYRAKHKCSHEEYEHYLEVNYLAKMFSKYTKNKEILKHIYSYLGLEDVYYSYDYTRRFYQDYIQMCQKLGLDLNDWGVWFPKDLKAKHDQVSATLNRIEQEKLQKEREEKAKKKKGAWAKYIENNNALYSIKCANEDLELRVLNDTMDFIKVGNSLHICVGSNGYDEKMLEGNCYIVVAYNNDKPVECCELDKKLNIVQLRGEHNATDGKFHEKSKELIDRFIGMFKLTQTQTALA